MGNWEHLLAELYDHLEERDFRFELLRDIDRQILDRSRQPLDLVIHSLDRLVRLIDARSGFLFLKHEGCYKFVTQLGLHGSGDLYTGDISIDALPAFGDLQRPDRYPSIARWLPVDTKSFIVHEIVVEGQVWGVLFLESQRPVQSSKEFVDTVLRQVTIALQDLRGHTRLEQYQRIHDLFFSTDLDQDKCLQILRDHVLKILEGHQGRLLVQILFRADTDVYGLEKPTGASSEHLLIRWSSNEQEIGARVPLESFSGRALEAGGRYLMADPTSEGYADIYKAFSEFATRTELAISIRKDLHSEPLGVVNIESPNELAFNSSELANLLDLVSLVSPILVAVRRRILMARQNREASLYAVNSYLQNAKELFDHKLASRRVAVDLNLHTASTLAKRDQKTVILESIESIGTDFLWIQDSLKELWESLSSIASTIDVNVHRVLQDIAGEEKASAQKYLCLDSEKLKLLPAVRASRLLKEHLRNLILNSVVSLDQKQRVNGDFKGLITLSGEEITIRQNRAGQVDGDPVAELNRRVRIMIRDNGVGISPEDMVKVFIPGWSSYGTQGYGLPAARDYAREFGGDLKIESVRNEYCQVWLELPVYG